jgi:CO/xanthine dehydrogenase Mo-binding subunit
MPVRQSTSEVRSSFETARDPSAHPVACKGTTPLSRDELIEVAETLRTAAAVIESKVTAQTHEPAHMEVASVPAQILLARKKPKIP